MLRPLLGRLMLVTVAISSGPALSSFIPTQSGVIDAQAPCQTPRKLKLIKRGIMGYECEGEGKTCEICDNMS